jgi:tRNA(fMet)-specific endonuclease VapC
MLDTNAVSSLMRQPTGPVYARIAAHPTAVISIITLAELRFGIAKVNSSRLQVSLHGLLRYLPVLPFDVPADTTYATLCAHLEQKGAPIRPNDLLIAAHAIALDMILVTANIGEFSRVPGLKVENWLD